MAFPPSSFLLHFACLVGLAVAATSCSTLSKVFWVVAESAAEVTPSPTPFWDLIGEGAKGIPPERVWALEWMGRQVDVSTSYFVRSGWKTDLFLRRRRRGDQLPFMAFKDYRKLLVVFFSSAPIFR